VPAAKARRQITTDGNRGNIGSIIATNALPGE
jgi:hypothetical protein